MLDDASYPASSMTLAKAPALREGPNLAARVKARIWEAKR
jgi:hypothetical protein